MEYFYELQEKLSVKLNEATRSDEKRQILFDHLSKVTKISLPKVSPLLRTDQDWLNTERPLSWERDLQGRILVLDFFTYCCVNCLHLLPTLRRLEEEFPTESGLAVVGVHSAKFENERSTANVASAILQNDIRHCVLNDPRAELWTALQISCWPTLLIVGPTGQPLFVLMGEGHQESLFLFCRTALDYFNDQVDCRPLPLRMLRDSSSSRSFLRYPGKVTWAPGGDIVVLADSGNNRIVILTPDAVVKETVGGPEPGFKDGSLHSSLFNKPQGVAIWSQDLIYVADTENHAIRLIDLKSCRVITVAGTGQQGSDYEGGGIGTEQAISSPWDLCLAPPFGSVAATGGESADKSILYICMAGIHQIWALFLSDTPWPKCSNPVKKGTCRSVAGSGKEENRNNAYPQRAGFAQPSGLTYCPERHCLFVADSESSTIRSISLSDGSVKGVVGGDLDPTNLFAFGDQNGKGLEARLQHPLGVTWGTGQKLLYVADTYNHKVKSVDPFSRQCQEVSLDRDLHEPGGLCILGDGHLLVADTQAHTLLKVTLNGSEGRVTEVPIVAVSESSECCVDGIRKSPHASVPDERVIVESGSTLTLCLKTHLQEGLEFSEGGPQTWRLELSSPTSGGDGSVTICSPTKGQLDTKLGTTKIVLNITGISGVSDIVTLVAKTFVCDKVRNVCLVRDSRWTLRIEIAGTSSDSVSNLDLTWHVMK